MRSGGDQKPLVSEDEFPDFVYIFFSSLHEFDNCQVFNRQFFFYFLLKMICKGNSIHLFKLYPSIRYRIKILRLDIMAKNTVIV